jgi:hypothetical protein
VHRCTLGVQQLAPKPLEVLGARLDRAAAGDWFRQEGAVSPRASAMPFSVT